MAKAYPDDTNAALRLLARRVIAERFGGTQARLAESFDVSEAFISDFLNEKRGAGLETLLGLARFHPLELLGIMGIDPSTIAVLWLDGGSSVEDDNMRRVPDEVRRAARAAVELTGCLPGEAGQAALAAWAEHGEVPGADPEWWLAKIRDHLPRRHGSGVRKSTPGTPQ